MNGSTSFVPERRGISLLELMAVVAIIGVLAVFLVPRVSSGAKDSQAVECHVQVGVIELQASLWRRSRGTFPTATLSDVGADKQYFPEGLPSCPVDGTAYQINTMTGRVTGHSHQ